MMMAVFLFILGMGLTLVHVIKIMAANVTTSIQHKVADIKAQGPDFREKIREQAQAAQLNAQAMAKRQRPVQVEAPSDGLTVPAPPSS